MEMLENTGYNPPPLGGALCHAADLETSLPSMCPADSRQRHLSLETAVHSRHSYRGLIWVKLTH